MTPDLIVIFARHSKCYYQYVREIFWSSPQTVGGCARADLVFYGVPPLGTYMAEDS